MGNLLLECFAGSGEAQLNAVLFLCCLSHALPCRTLSGGLGASKRGKRGCSVSESISVVSQMNRTVSARDAGELEYWG